MCNLSISAKAASLMISGALSGSSGCLWYDERTTMLLVQYLTSMKSCDVQDSKRTSYICVTSVCQSSGPTNDLQCVEWSIQLFVIWWDDHQAFYWASFIIGTLWYAGCKQYISYTCKLHISVNTGCSIISRSLNRSAWRCPDGLLSLIYQSYKYIWYTIGRLHGTPFQWSKVLKRKLCIQLIISQATIWSISCTRYHWMGF